MDTEIVKSSDLTGQVVGQYHITGRLGRGGMADVYKALHTELKVHRAIKFIRPEFVTSEDFRTRFQKEAQAVAKLEHPNIVRIHDFGNSDNQYYMVMQYIEGLDLKNKLLESNTLPIDQAIDLTVTVAGALSYAHERDLIHRDIKPDNIMLDEKGAPILMDFGIAKLLTENTALTQTGAGIGTPAYMAPEQAQGQTITAATDIYALAIVLYELVTGTKPYNADTPIAVMLKAISDPLPLPRTINPNVSEELQAVIIKASAKDPLQRYQTAEEFAEDLRAVRTGTQPTIALTAPVKAGIKPAVPGAANETSTTKTVATTVARGLSWLGALTLAIGLGALYWWWSDDNPAEETMLAEPAIDTTSDTTSDKAANAPTTSPTATTPTASTPTASTQAPTTPANITPATTSTSPAAPPPAKSIAFEASGSSAGDGEIFAYRDTLSAGQVVESDIELNEGDTLFLQVHKASKTTDFKLISPNGREPIINYYNSKGPVEIKETGTHRLSIVPRGGKESTIDAQLFRLGEASLNGGAISFGDYQSATTQWPGQRVSYTADLAAGDWVYFELERSAATTDFTLRSFDDRSNLINYYNSTGPVEITASGSHQFYADPRGAALGDYEFILHKLDPAVISGGNYQPNSYAEASTVQPGQIVRYNVDFNEGDSVYFEVTRSKATTDFVLAEPGGRKNVFSYYNSTGPFVLKQSGIYTLTANPRSTNLGDYEFRLHKLAPGIIQGGEIVPNEVTSGATTQPGQIAHYSLTLDEPSKVGLEVVKSSNTTDYTLRAADDRSNIFSYYGNVGSKPLGPGTYKFIVDPRASKLSEYEFLLRVQSNGG